MHNVELVKNDKVDDLLIVRTYSEYPQLPTGEYTALIGKISGCREEGIYGKYVKLTIPFLVKDPDSDDTITINFQSSNSMHPSGRLAPIIKGILGEMPDANFNLVDLEGAKVKVKLDDYMSPSGNIRSSVVSARKFRQKKKIENAIE